MKRVLILGAGTAGLIVANKLSRDLRREAVRGEVEVKVIDRTDSYVLEAGYTLLLVDQLRQEDIIYRKRELLDPVITFYKGDVTKIDLKNRAVETHDGVRHSYDYLVIALGARYDLSYPPGLSNDYNTYYGPLEKVVELRNKLREFKRGRIVQLVVMPDEPIKCPIAPAKSSLLIDGYLRHITQTRAQVEYYLLTPTDHLHAQPEVNKELLLAFQERGLNVIFNFSAAEVDPKEKVVISESGEKVKYDLLISVPLHRGPEAVAKSEIGNPFGFLPADRRTLQYRRGKEHYDDVYILGDVASIGVARAGATAHYQANVVAYNISCEIKGLGCRRLYQGEAICPLLSDVPAPANWPYKGRAWMPWWNYGHKADPFVPTDWGWWIMKMYYLSIPLTLRGLI
ncbi:NAD(P)/FAD-dependent oxidoreductase [Thermoproteus tenax]|uniref:Sulfide dehydrogenase, flavoprtotein subunit n=1 Tax=Thermoproteus tenax (strain ATCC 35583 / DSM 2078 / JCM 9277 / NBRC 100435 / Kra 1) TaxID=768679 RepID=G4RJT9_THETK|nr:FAD/NAD(P)-binding oxidoreductase [Thermoproteus tenax]CCC81834.1 sulfide dehydrogenase, flavoprtotein subunit [Thermoproteus tenax Kra 1]